MFSKYLLGTLSTESWLRSAPLRRFYAAIVSTFALAATIRGRIFIAFLIMTSITAALGGYSALGIQNAGRLVSRTFDESLMSINFARATSADFAAMEATFARRWLATEPELQRQLDKKMEELNATLIEDLGIAAERSHSPRAAEAAKRVADAARSWNVVSARLIRDAKQANWLELDQFSDTVNQQIDLLINYTAGQGFTYRQSARAAFASNMQWVLTGTACALILSAIVAWLLARQIVGPVATASSIAGRIASGEMDGVIPQGSRDEMGSLLIAMGVMRNNIKGMMEREVAQRRTAQLRLADALENSQEGVVVVDADGRIVLANSQIANFLGSPSDLLAPGALVREIASKAQNDSLILCPSILLDQSLPTTFERRLEDGRWLRVSRSIMREGGSMAVCTDITFQKQQQEALKTTNLRLDAALSNMSQGLCLYDANDRLEVFNRRFCEIFHLPDDIIHPGMTLREIEKLGINLGNFKGGDAATLVAAQRALGRSGAGKLHFQELSEGRVIAIARQPLPDGRWLCTYEDVTERRRSEEQIAFMARHDALTGLPNRILFGEQIEEAISHLEKGLSFAVLCLDLDRFKHINDTLGHPVGDGVLRAVAERLRTCLRENDTVARLGGDEFAIVQRGISQTQEVEQLARRVIECLSQTYDLDGQRVSVGVSIGIALANEIPTTYEKLLKNADVALYRAKGDGRGTWKFFEPDMDAGLQARRALEFDLKEALANNEFELFYHPIYDFGSESLSGFEALLRWRHPTKGMIGPSDFIPIAEEIGLIVPLGEWVLRYACSEATRWGNDIKLAVNVSAAQFKDGDLIEMVTNVLSSTGLEPHRLELEITETVLLAENIKTLAILQQLHALGVNISMDDFGTGYSSLSYLRSFPFDKIKIDQSFISDLLATTDSGAIVRAMISLGRSLGMVTLAEGVETLEQLEWLREEGCDEVQGYFFSVPVSAEQTLGLVERWTHRNRAVA
jgi:diguanylate cyclase (GGDEF)-like protein/PAS domain S-box-containing protein